MKKYRLATVFLIALMATTILTLTPPLTSLTSADPWSTGRGPPIVIESTNNALSPPERAGIGDFGSISEWEPIKALNEDDLGDTEAWSSNVAMLTNVSLWNTGLHELDAGNVTVNNMARDLKALYMWFDPVDTMYIRLDVAALRPGSGPGAYNASLYAITLSTNLSFPSWDMMTGIVPTSPLGLVYGMYDGIFYNYTCAWEYILAFSDTFATLIQVPGVQIANDTWQGAGVGNNIIQMACDYANGAIEIAFPRALLSPTPLGVVCISVLSFKVGLDGNVSLGESPILHPFDPQAVLAGACPPSAGEEGPGSPANGPDHADVMAPATVSGAMVNGFQVIENQKLVDMSPGAKVHIYDTLTDQQNITDAYNQGDSLTLDIEIVDAIRLSGFSVGLTFDNTVLNCTAFTVDFGNPFLGSAMNWMIGALGTIDNPNGRVYPPCGIFWNVVGAPPSGTGILVKVTFDVLAVYGTSWICPAFTMFMFDLGGDLGSQVVEIPIKNAWFEIHAPSPGPPEVRYTQTPATPPHYPDDEIQFSLCTSKEGFNGTHWIPIVNYSMTVKNSTDDVLYTYLGPSHLLNFTPTYPDTYTFILDIHLDPDFDPYYNPDWLYDETTVEKTVIERALSGIDCYTEVHRWCGYTTDYKGIGWNMSADAFALDENVTIYSYVFYNNWPKQSFLVSYEVYDPNGTLVLVRNAMTNGSGISTISFRILTVCENPEYAFGKWRIFQKVKMSDVYYNDTLWFDVGWLWELLLVEPTQDIFSITWDTADHMGFYIYYKSISIIPRTIVYSVTVYDDDGVPIGCRTGETTAIPATYCNPAEDSFLVECLEIPKWVYPGVCKVYVNAWFNGLPTQCGHPACPEISAIFIIEAEAPPWDP